MKIEIEAVGLQELINKLDSASDEKMTAKVQKQALKPVADKILNEIKMVTPVSKVRSIHGIDAEMIKAFTRSGYKGFDVGITNQGQDWERIRGVWFQNWKIDEPNYGWFTNYKAKAINSWEQEVRESVKIAVISYLLDIGFTK